MPSKNNKFQRLGNRVPLNITIDGLSHARLHKLAELRGCYASHIVDDLLAAAFEGFPLKISTQEMKRVNKHLSSERAAS
jgi:hypothetical protein